MYVADVARRCAQGGKYGGFGSGPVDPPSQSSGGWGLGGWGEWATNGLSSTLSAVHLDKLDVGAVTGAAVGVVGGVLSTTVAVTGAVVGSAVETAGALGVALGVSVQGVL